MNEFQVRVVRDGVTPGCGIATLGRLIADAEVSGDGATEYGKAKIAQLASELLVHCALLADACGYPLNEMAQMAFDGDVAYGDKD